jgi:hypothetical protein
MLFSKIHLWSQKAVLSTTLIRVLNNMQWLIRGITIGTCCLQWSLPALAYSDTCQVSAPVPPVELNSLNKPFTTELTATGAHFRLICSCDSGRSPKEAMLSIINEVLSSGSADIAEPDGSFYKSISVSPTLRTTQPEEQVYDYLYSVKVSALNGEILKPGGYSVPVKFSPPLCTSDIFG